MPKAGRRAADREYFDGWFKVTQTRGAKPITVLTLNEPLSCPRSQAACSERGGQEEERAPPLGRRKGAFRTTGNYSSATVRGTKWLVEDTLRGTLTRVVRGKRHGPRQVRNKTVVVRRR